MKEPIQKKFSTKLAKNFVKNMIEKYRAIESQAGKRKINAVIYLMRRYGAIADEHVMKYESEKLPATVEPAN